MARNSKTSAHSEGSFRVFRRGFRKTFWFPSSGHETREPIADLAASSTCEARELGTPTPVPWHQAPNLWDDKGTPSQGF